MPKTKIEWNIIKCNIVENTKLCSVILIGYIKGVKRLMAQWYYTDDHTIEVCYITMFIYKPEWAKGAYYLESNRVGMTRGYLNIPRGLDINVANLRSILHKNNNLIVSKYGL